jgi:hypothetical protein
METSSLIRLLYVSISRVDAAEPDTELARIVAVARERNALLGVTGGLVYTGANFAQVLEGPAQALEELMKSIHADPRHTRVDVIFSSEQPDRLFSDWLMAYSGPSQYVNARIAPLLDDCADALRRRRAGDALVHLIHGFASEGGHAAA